MNVSRFFSVCSKHGNLAHAASEGFCPAFVCSRKHVLLISNADMSPREGTPYNHAVDFCSDGCACARSDEVLRIYRPVYRAPQHAGIPAQPFMNSSSFCTRSSASSVTPNHLPIGLPVIQPCRLFQQLRYTDHFFFPPVTSKNVHRLSRSPAPKTVY